MILKSNSRTSMFINKNKRKCLEKYKNKDQLLDNLFPSAHKNQIGKVGKHKRNQTDLLESIL